MRCGGSSQPFGGFGRADSGLGRSITTATRSQGRSRKTPKKFSLTHAGRRAVEVAMAACSFSLPSIVQADEDPPHCSVAGGGLGNTSECSLEFQFDQAHVGDEVPISVSFWMVPGACSASQLTGSLWVGTGWVTNLFEDISVDRKSVV